MHVASIHIYPVKGCHRLDLATAAVEPWGLAGDRRWLVVDPESGVAITQRDTTRLTQVQPSYVDDGLRLAAPGLPDLAVTNPRGPLVPVTVWSSTIDAAVAGLEADAWLSKVLDRPARLVYLDDPTRRVVNPKYGEPTDRVSFADGYPLLLANTASLDVLNDWIVEAGNEPVPMTRFRPNIVMTDAPAWVEDSFTGRRVRIGSMTFRVPKPCDRCVVTTTDQETGERGKEPLRTLGRHRNIDQGLLFATNLIPDGPGRIEVGEPVLLS